MFIFKTSLNNNYNLIIALFRTIFPELVDLLPTFSVGSRRDSCFILINLLTDRKAKTRLVSSLELQVFIKLCRSKTQ